MAGNYYQNVYKYIHKCYVGIFERKKKETKRINVSFNTLKYWEVNKLNKKFSGEFGQAIATRFFFMNFCSKNFQTPKKKK